MKSHATSNAGFRQKLLRFLSGLQTPGFGIPVIYLYLLSDSGTSMARSDSFFLRATVPTDTTAFNQVQIDLGSVVNVLAKDILRIHNIQVEYGQPAENIQNLAVDSQTELSFQLTTQSQGDLVPLSNRSVVSSGQLKVSTGPQTADVPIVYSDTMNASIQEWTNGYLIAVESLYLGCKQGADILSQVSIILECTSETMSQAAAMALSLSQQ